MLDRHLGRHQFPSETIIFGERDQLHLQAATPTFSAMALVETALELHGRLGLRQSGLQTPSRRLPQAARSSSILCDM